MAHLSVADPPALAAPAGLHVLSLQRALLGLVAFCGCIVFIEPSPYEVTTLLALAVFMATGLRMRPIFLPLITLLILINLGYSISAVPLLDQSNVFFWIMTSWYMAVTAIFFAMAMSEDTAERLDAIRRGYVAGAVIASLAGIAGYFHLVPGGDDLLTLYGRARGTFKDPNVLGAFLILPALFALQGVLIDRFGKATRDAVLYGLFSLAILLSFSRAAWGQLVLTSAFVIALTFLTSRSVNQRSRVVLVTGLAVAALAMMLAVLLSVDSIASVFQQRASFDQSYDTGRFGRFGRHVLGAAMALDLPLGIGPLQFNKFFPEDTHNSFLNAFMSGGWLAGLCYPALMFMTVILGWRYALVRLPWQRAYLAVFAAFLGAFCESFIIDTDHWRHYFMLLGAMWGMFAAAQIELHRRRTMPAPVSIPPQG